MLFMSSAVKFNNKMIKNRKVNEICGDKSADHRTCCHTSKRKKLNEIETAQTKKKKQFIA